MRRLLPLLMLLMLLLTPSALAWEDYTVYPTEDNAPRQRHLLRQFARRVC